MGISGLLPFLQDSSRRCHISDLRGSSVAIDSYCWLHKGAFGCADKLIRGEKTDLYVQYCLNYIKLLQNYSIKPVLVFDGQRLPAKRETEKKRHEQRKNARVRGNELLRLGKPHEARIFFRQCIDINHEMALSLIKECRSKGIDCIVAPYEADAQLAFLNIKGLVDFVITEDSDLVLFGCKKILFKFGLDGYGTLIEQGKLITSMKMRPNEYTFDKVRYMCIMSGCDYLDSLPGIGLKKAHRAVTMTHDHNIYNLLPRLPRYLNMAKLVVPPEYIENFKLADATIRHQVVFNPITRRLERLTDPESCGTDIEYLRNAGQMYNCDKALQMALGNIDPISHKVMDNWNPDAIPQNTTSIWSTSFNISSVIRNKDRASGEVSSFETKVTANVSMGSTRKVNSNTVEEEKAAYDNKLMEEIHMYKNSKPLVTSQVEEPVKEEIKKVKASDLMERNPFLKLKSLDSHNVQLIPEKNDRESDESKVCKNVNVDPDSLSQKSKRLTELSEMIENDQILKPKRISKFEPTYLEKKMCVKSRFFAPKNTARSSFENVDQGELRNDANDEIEAVAEIELRDEERSLSPVLSFTGKNKTSQVNDQSFKSFKFNTTFQENSFKGSFKPSNTSRQVGLSKKRKRGLLQPTLLNMFSNMESNGFTKKSS